LRRPFDVAVIEKICSWKRFVARRPTPSLTRCVNDLFLSFSESNTLYFFLSFFLSGAEVNTAGAGTGKGHTGHCTLPIVVRVVGTHTRRFRTVVQQMRRSGEGVRVLLTLIGGSGLYYCVRRCRTRTHSDTRRIQYTHTHVG